MRTFGQHFFKINTKHILRKIYPVADPRECWGHAPVGRLYFIIIHFFSTEFFPNNRLITLLWEILDPQLLTVSHGLVH